MGNHACLLYKIVSALVIIGAINWGLVGFFSFNLVDYIFGAGSILSHIIYSVVGISGLVLLAGYFTGCSSCKKE